MNKELFQKIFGKMQGYVYIYKGTIPPEESKTHYITELFSEAAGTNLLNTVVVELPNFGATVIYVDADEILINSIEFELLTDLTPTKIIESAPIIIELVPETGE